MQSKFEFWIVVCGRRTRERERERERERGTAKEDAFLKDGGEKNNAEDTLLSPNGMKLKLR